jgi:hypothetical protein
MQPPRVNSVFAGSGNWCRGFGVCLQALLLGNVGFPLSEQNRNGFWIFKYEEKKILSQLNFTFCVLLRVWDVEQMWRVAYVTTSCLWWRHTFFMRTGFCSMKCKRNSRDVIRGFIRAFTWRNWRKLPGIFRMVVIIANIWTRELLNKKQKWYRLYYYVNSVSLWHSLWPACW